MGDAAPSSVDVVGTERIGTWPPGRKWKSALAAFYLFVQLLLPLTLLTTPGLVVRDFAWDMFSHGLSCSKLDCIATARGGLPGSVRLDRDFGSLAQLIRVLLPGRLEGYARYLCRRLEAEAHSPVELHFIAECRDGRQEAARNLVDPARDYCLGAP
jgi:hypothetical protein